MAAGHGASAHRRQRSVGPDPGLTLNLLWPDTERTPKFKIIDHPESPHKVRVMVPTDGGHVEQTFKARFRVLPKEDSHDLDSDAGIDAFLRGGGRVGRSGR